MNLTRSALRSAAAILLLLLPRPLSTQQLKWKINRMQAHYEHQLKIWGNCRQAKPRQAESSSAKKTSGSI